MYYGKHIFHFCKSQEGLYKRWRQLFFFLREVCYEMEGLVNCFNTSREGGAGPVSELRKR